jgi:hypothetical protein
MVASIGDFMNEMQILNDVKETAAHDTVKQSAETVKPGMIVNTRPVDKKEIEHIMGLVKNGFKKTPPRLSYEKGEYDAMNTVLAITNFETCENDLDAIRCFYESLFPTVRNLHVEKEKLESELTMQRKDLLPVIEEMVKEKDWKAGDYSANFIRMAELIKKGYIYEQAF